MTGNACGRVYSVQPNYVPATPLFGRHIDFRNMGWRVPKPSGMCLMGHQKCPCKVLFQSFSCQNTANGGFPILVLILSKTGIHLLISDHVAADSPDSEIVCFFSRDHDSES